MRCILAQTFLFLALCVMQGGEVFKLPTPNRAIFEKGGEERYFVGTVGKPWTSGTFGCVRSGGWQMHEGIDIGPVARDSRGEATDAVMASADGVVVYMSHKAALSNYGIYVVLRHSIEGLEVYTLYAHLAAIGPLKIGQAVSAGQVIGKLGRTANTREGISKDRAHLHFEVNLLINERYATWFRSTNPKQRNDHGDFNGQNFLGLDPRLIFLKQRELGNGFSLVRFIQEQPELLRVMVRDTSFPWLRRYPQLVKPNGVAAREGIAGYELALNYNGVPIALTPRAASEMKTKAKYALLSVNDAEYRKNPGRRLVSNTRGKWQLASRGVTLLDVMTY